MSDAAPTAADASAEADRAIASFGLRPTRENLYSMAAEMERRLRIHPLGPVAAAAVARELRRRAVAAGG